MSEYYCSPFIMQSIPGYPCYSITRDGTVYSHKRRMGGWKYDPTYSRELAQTTHYKGYKVVQICDNGKEKNMFVHRLVALTYIPNPDNLETVNHINENKLDNRVENLEWMSQTDNLSYSWAKTYIIETPTKDIIKVKNLAEFCRKELGEDCSANMRRSMNTNYRCKGYKLLKKI